MSDEHLNDESADEWIQEASGPSATERILQKEINALKRQLLESEGIEDLIRRTVATHYERAPDLLLPPAPKLTGKGTEQVAIAHVSDTQLGKRTMSYDVAVGAKRLHKYAQTVVEITQIKRSRVRIDHLRLYLGGDMVEGEYGNYPSQPYDVESSVIRQAMRDTPVVRRPL